jgi:uncharacterized protein (DUF58 family)
MRNVSRRFDRRIAAWLEIHWIAPAYSGWLLGGLSLFFFAAATNTMAGWLYVISGVMLALITIAAILPRRSLRDIHIHRHRIEPVSLGDLLRVEIELNNQTTQPKTLIQIEDMLPNSLGQPRQGAIELIPPHGTYRWVYMHPTERRGVYRWQAVSLRTAAPLGLFWSRRDYAIQATAVVYPTVLPLNQCPLIDEMGRDTNAQVQSSYNPYGASEGLTRTLRPYRWGDPTRLVHWRTSARFGELRVRELEVFTGGQEIIIGLDSAIAWQPEAFEQAVSAAASFYWYARQHHLEVSLWTAGTGIMRGEQVVLEALAATIAGEKLQVNARPNAPLLWLTRNPASLNTLPDGSRWALWSDFEQTLLDVSLTKALPGLLIQFEQPLQSQIQAPPKS